MKLNFCPECSAPLHQKTKTEYVCDNGHPYWNNPRTAVAVVLLNNNNEVLYSKRAHNPKQGLYDFPGGFVDYGETIYEAMTRELQEETGLIAKELTLIHSTAQIYVENTSVCDVVFVTRKWQGQPVPADDVAALEWKPIEFIDSKEFAWGYSGLVEKLRNFIKEQ
jgi:mutator protein MutT